MSARCFYISMLSHILLEEINLSFQWSGLEKYNPISESCLTGVFKSIMVNLWINTYQNLNAFQTAYVSHN